MIVILRVLLYSTTYAILTDASAAANWVLGIALGTGVALFVGRRRVRRQPGWLTRLAWSPVLLWGMLRRVLSGTWQMFQVLIGRRPWQHVGFVESRHVTETPDGATLLALIQSVSPGSVAAEVDAEAGTLILNVIDAREAAQEEAAVRRFYDRYQKRTVP